MVKLNCYNCDGEGITPSIQFINWLNYNKDNEEEYKKDNPSKICNKCNGEKTIVYKDNEEYFNLLADRWDEENVNKSYINKKHPCYKSIKKIGNKLAPFILRRMQKKETWLFIILANEINKNKYSITNKEEYLLNDLTKEWINWGKWKKLIK